MTETKNDAVLEGQMDMDDFGNADDIFGMIGTNPLDLKEEKPKKEEKKPAVKKESAKAEKGEKKPNAGDSKKNGTSFTYPFRLYFCGAVHDVTGLFEDGVKYTGNEITKKMMEAHFYEFAGSVEYDYMAETNTVVAMFMQHKKG